MTVFFVLQDYEHVTLLWERFKEFAKETELMGSERVSTVNQIADSLISAGHTDAATIAQWKDALNDAWADLGELIDTRYLLLKCIGCIYFLQSAKIYNSKVRLSYSRLIFSPIFAKLKAI